MRALQVTLLPLPQVAATASRRCTLGLHTCSSSIDCLMDSGLSPFAILKAAFLPRGAGVEAGVEATVEATVVAGGKKEQRGREREGARRG